MVGVGKKLRTFVILAQAGIYCGARDTHLRGYDGSVLVASGGKIAYDKKKVVTRAKVGGHCVYYNLELQWIPASAGMTISGGRCMGG